MCTVLAITTTATTTHITSMDTGGSGEGKEKKRGLTHVHKGE